MHACVCVHCMVGCIIMQMDVPGAPACLPRCGNNALRDFLCVICCVSFFNRSLPCKYDPCSVYFIRVCVVLSICGCLMLVLFVDTQHAVPVKRCMCMGAAGHEGDRMKKHSSCSPDRHACSLQQGLWHLVPLSVPQRCMLARHGPRMIHNSQYREAQYILLMYNGARSLAAVSPSIVLSLSTKMLQCLNNSNKHAHHQHALLVWH